MINIYYLILNKCRKNAYNSYASSEESANDIVERYKVFEALISIVLNLSYMSFMQARLDAISD